MTETPEQTDEAPEGRRTMKAPIDREMQIEMMKAAKERHDALVSRWLNDPAVREMLRKPSPKQTSYSTVKQGVRLRKCA